LLAKTKTAGIASGFFIARFLSMVVFNLSQLNIQRSKRRTVDGIYKTLTAAAGLNFAQLKTWLVYVMQFT
jgi:hypothetical protein